MKKKMKDPRNNDFQRNLELLGQVLFDYVGVKSRGVDFDPVFENSFALTYIGFKLSSDEERHTPPNIGPIKAA